MSISKLADHDVRRVTNPGERSEMLGDIADLMDRERFGVLSTSLEDGWPYGTLISYAFTGDLRQLLFVTPRDTVKYANICRDGRVSMLVTDQRNDPGDVHGAVSLTIMGTASIVSDDHRGDATPLLAARHPELLDFIGSGENALVRIDVKQYILVSRFQAVRVLTMETPRSIHGDQGSSS